MRVSVRTSRRRIPATAGRRVLVSIFAIAALLLCLFSMHAIESTASANSPALAQAGQDAQASQDVQATAQAPESGVSVAISSSPIEACGAVCGMNCVLAGVVCGLSVLTAIAGLLLMRGPAAVQFSSLQIIRVLRIAAQHIVIPVAPSLNVLSINRT